MALSKHEGAIFLLCVILCIEKDAELKGDVSKLLVFNKHIMLVEGSDWKNRHPSILETSTGCSRNL